MRAIRFGVNENNNKKLVVVVVSLSFYSSLIYIYFGQRGRVKNHGPPSLFINTTGAGAARESVRILFAQSHFGGRTKITAHQIVNLFIFDSFLLTCLFINSFCIFMVCVSLCDRRDRLRLGATVGRRQRRPTPRATLSSSTGCYLAPASFLPAHPSGYARPLYAFL